MRGTITRKRAPGRSTRRLSDINKRDWQTFAALVLSPGIPTISQPHRLVNGGDDRRAGDRRHGAVRARRAGAARTRASESRRHHGHKRQSSTTALIGHVLKEAGRDVRVGGNIGTGVLDLEAAFQRGLCAGDASYQLDLVKSLHCNVAVMLNLSPDHLDRHGGMEGYQ